MLITNILVLLSGMLITRVLCNILFQLGYKETCEKHMNGIMELRAALVSVFE